VCLGENSPFSLFSEKHWYPRLMVNGTLGKIFPKNKLPHFDEEKKF
jgi:hypothetical protein